MAEAEVTSMFLPLRVTLDLNQSLRTRMGDHSTAIWARRWYQRCYARRTCQYYSFALVPAREGNDGVCFDMTAFMAMGRSCDQGQCRLSECTALAAYGRL